MPGAAMSAVRAFDDLLDRSNLTGRQFLIYAGQRLHPGVVLYNSVYAIRWPDLDPQRFKLAWQSARRFLRCACARSSTRWMAFPSSACCRRLRSAVDHVDLRVEDAVERALENWIDGAAAAPHDPRPSAYSIPR